jgi:phosphoribosylformylglycinamidine cyclo-ligase
MKHSKITYSQVGDNYATKDPVKKLAQTAAQATAVNLKKHGFAEIADTRGESAYVWKQGKVLMASVIEGLGTKNLVADAMRQITGKTYYDVIAYDTVATIINDLITVGATPLVIHAYWAVENNDWLADRKRMADFIRGWKKACDDAGVSWGGGETPTLKGIINPGTIELGGSAVGIIGAAKNLITDENLKTGDAIILVRSSGINANGLSLARAVAGKLPLGYKTKLPDGSLYGEAILQKTHIYAGLIQALQKAGVNIHYISNITGHGLRKVMRAKGKFSYIIEKIFAPQPLFHFIREKAELSDYDMYGTFNMGMDYAVFVAPKDSARVIKLIGDNGFAAMVSGHITDGPKQVIIKPKNIIFDSATLDLR